MSVHNLISWSADSDAMAQRSPSRYYYLPSITIAPKRRSNHRYLAKQKQASLKEEVVSFGTVFLVFAHYLCIIVSQLSSMSVCKDITDYSNVHWLRCSARLSRPAGLHTYTPSYAITSITYGVVSTSKPSACVIQSTSGKMIGATFVGILTSCTLGCTVTGSVRGHILV